MAAGGSTKVIVISLIANFSIALAKLGGAFFTGSASLLAEAVHSFSDCGNQALLLYGTRASKKGVSAEYPLGKSKEIFFWSFVVAILLFTMGGMFSLYEGLHKIQHPEEVSSPLIGVIILLFAIALESYSFWACLKEVKKVNQHKSLWQWIRHTNAADLMVIFLEDLAALLGLILALIALGATWITGNALWDGIGSCCIGVLLVVVAIIIAREIKSLLIGEKASGDYENKLAKLLQESLPEAKILKLIALQRGVNSVLLAYKIHPGSSDIKLYEAIEKINKFEKEVKNNFAEVEWQFAELDFTDD